MDVEAVTYSKISNNFVFHIPKEYDYYLCTPDKDEILEYLLKIHKENGNENLKFFLVEDIDLFKYTKKEGEKDNHFPDVTPVEMNL